MASLPEAMKAGYRFQAVAPANSALAQQLTTQGVEVHPWREPLHGVRRSLEERRTELASALQRLRPDLLHANSLAMSRLSGPVASDMGIPSIGHLRDIISLSRQAIADLNRHTRLLAVSAATRNWHIAQGVDAGKTFVCYNGVDLTVFCPRPPTGFLHRELQLPAQTLLMGSIGQVGVRKGLDTTLTAFRRLAPRWETLHWIIVGERTSTKDEAIAYERQLHEDALRSPLAGRVHFLGVRHDVPRLLNELTLLAHAARQEPLGRVLLEAAASGTPLIASDVGGTREILPPDTFTSSLVPPDEPAALEQAIHHLMDNPQERERLAVHLRQRAAAAFDIRHAAQRLLVHYSEVQSSDSA